MTQPHYIDRGLLPCPFRGGPADTYGNDELPEAFCKSCDAVARDVAAWNRRPAMEAVAWREALTEALAGLEKIARIAEQPGIETVHDAKDWAHCAAVVAMCGPKVTAARQALAVIPIQGGEGRG